MKIVHSLPRQALPTKVIVAPPRPMIKHIWVQILQKNCLVNPQRTILRRKRLRPQIWRQVVSHRRVTKPRSRANRYLISLQ